MIDREHLKYVITEDLYLIQEKKVDSAVHHTEPAPDDTNTEENENKLTSKPTAWLLVATKTLEEGEKELLSKILDAVGVKNDDYELEVGSTKKITQFEKAIIFFSQPVGGDFYKIGNYKGTQLLSSKPLSDLKDSRDEKMKLWKALKMWFNIN